MTPKQIKYATLALPALVTILTVIGAALRGYV